VLRNIAAAARCLPIVKLPHGHGRNLNSEDLPGKLRFSFVINSRQVFTARLGD